MLEELFEQQDKKFNTFKEFIKGKNFKEIKNYYIANELHKSTSPPAIYIFTFNKCKKYVGKADCLLTRLYDYIKSDGHHIHNLDLRDDMMYELTHFEYEILTEYNGEKVTYQNVERIENFITSDLKSKGIPIYNKTNFNKKTDLREINKSRNNTNKIIKGYEKTKDDFKGFSDIFG